jgi:low affinity Fe/Cu permease
MRKQVVGDGGRRYGFQAFARWVSNAAGKPSAFVLSVAVVIVWAGSGPYFRFSDTWQLVINTGTTVVTFWMVFVIQSSQNNDTHALQLKLDELIRATDSARNVFLGCEGLPDEAMRAFQEEFGALQRRAREQASTKAHHLPRPSPQR